MENFLTQHWRKSVNPKYLGSHDLFVDDKKYNEVVTQITAIRMEEITGDKNKKEICMVADLKGLKPLVLNRTNAKTITKLTGSQKPEKWIGLHIIIYVQLGVKAFGDIVDAIRIRDHKPTPAVQVDYTMQITAIQATESVEALGALWQGFSADEKSALVKIKDEQKSKLV